MHSSNFQFFTYSAGYAVTRCIPALDSGRIGLGFHECPDFPDEIVL